jgi:predicted dehydrogenase
MKIGIVGNGGIVQSALGHLKDAAIEVPALWCRNEAKGRPLQEQYGFQLYTDYDAFLKDPSFDTVYIGLINNLHYEYAMRAVDAGKNVILEKPFTSRYGETLNLIQEAEEKGVLLFEAIMNRYSKNYDSLIPHLDEIGDLKLIYGNFSKTSSRYEDYEKGIVKPAFSLEGSGGALYDINVYNIHTVVGMFGAPRFVQYLANKGFNGIDTSGVLTMDYDGFKAVCIGTKDSVSPNTTIFQGTKGFIEIPCRPGVFKNMTLHLNGQEPVAIGVQDEGNPMYNEFLRIQEVVDQHDMTQAAIWLVRTKQVMSVLDQARVSAGIHFPADDDPQFTVE